MKNPQAALFIEHQHELLNIGKSSDGAGLLIVDFGGERVDTCEHVDYTFTHWRQKDRLGLRDSDVQRVRVADLKEVFVEK